jgi:hypothetical protein
LKATFYSRSHEAVIRVYDNAGDFFDWPRVTTNRNGLAIEIRVSYAAFKTMNHAGI